MIGIDATSIFCPEFTTPVMTLIKKHIKPGEQGVIKTKESRALKRLQHLCVSFGWSVVAMKTRDDTLYIVIQC